MSPSIFQTLAHSRGDLKWMQAKVTTFSLPPDNLQTIQVFENGTMRVTKFGITWERALDGAEQEIKGVK